ncbi:serine--tRNA ligase [archaeon SCG-AAA382B04]|nr:serine--tRNA ligase [archaeon SCG-AAA382B04]
MGEVEFILKASLQLSEDIEENKEVNKDLKNFIEESNNSILNKGAPTDKGAHIEEYDLKNDKISLEIIGNKYVRAHEAIIRLINPLSNEIGPKHHIGVRGIKDIDYTIILKDRLEKNNFKEIKKELEELREIDTIERDKNNLILKTKSLKESDFRRGVVDRLISLVDEVVEGEEELVDKVTKIEPGTVISSSKDKKPLIKEDPTKIAQEKGWVKKFPGKGQWTYLPPYTKLLRALMDVATKEIPQKIDFQESMFPKLIPLEIMNKMKYLEGLPEGMYYSCSPKRGTNVYDLFKKEHKIKEEIPMDLLKDGLKDPGYVLAPAQCEPFYQLFSHEMMDEDNLPIKLFDKSGFTYRWEGGGSKGLDRVNEFQRIELVWIGKAKQVKTVTEEILEAYKKVLDDYLKVEWKIKVGDDPFYLEGRKGEMDEVEYPDIPKYEIQVKMPHNGENLSIGSVNLHGTHFVKGFSIRAGFEEPIWTGCAGLGVNRWVLAFLAYNGFEAQNWPKKIKEKTTLLPFVPKTLEWPKNKED